MKRLSLIMLALVAAVTASSMVWAVPDRATTYMIQSVKIPENRLYEIEPGVTSDISALFRRSIYDQVEFGVIDSPMQWMSTDRFASLIRNSSGSVERDYDNFELVQHTGAPILEYVKDPETETPVSIREKVSSLISGDIDNLKLTEVFPMYITGFDKQEEQAPLAPGTEEPVALHLVNSYPKDMDYVAVIGSQKGDTSAGASLETVKSLHDWKALRMEATDDSLVVYMTPEALEMANDRDTVMAIFTEGRTPAARTATVVPPHVEQREITTVVHSMEVTSLIEVMVEGYTEWGTDAEIVSSTRPNPELHIQSPGPRTIRVIQQLADYVDDQHSAVSYFGTEVRNKVMELLPGANVDELQVEEVVDSWVTGYDYDHGELVADLSFPVEYKDGDRLVTVAASYGDNGNVKAWTALKTTPKNSGARVVVTQNILTRMEENEINAMFVLREAKPGSEEAGGLLNP